MEGGASRCVALSAAPPVQGLQALVARKLAKRGAVEVETIAGSAEEGDVVLVHTRRLDDAHALRTALDGRAPKRLAGARLHAAFAPDSLLPYLRLSAPAAPPAAPPRLETFSVAPRAAAALGGGALLCLRVSVRGASSVEAAVRAPLAPLPADSVFDAPPPALLASVPAPAAAAVGAGAVTGAGPLPFGSSASAFSAAAPRSPTRAAAAASPKSPSVLRSPPPPSSPLAAFRSPAQRF